MILAPTNSEYRDAKAAVRASLTGHGGIAEPPPAGCDGHGPRPADERLIQLVWQEQMLDAARLATCSGKPVRVVAPGAWNGEAGPDFRMAELEIGGRRVRGDVEIHVDSQDWERHRHGRDFEYNGVVLHAFLRRTDGAAGDELHNGSKVERLELGKYLDTDLETIRRALSADDLPALGAGEADTPCAEAGLRLDGAVLGDFFRAAARERMEAKVARFAAQRDGETADQVLHQAVMTAMGYKGGKTLFFLLAKRAPVADLTACLAAVEPRDLPAALESVLLNVAGLLPSASCEAGPPLDAPTQDYLNAMNGWWGRLSGYFMDRIIPPTRRWHAGVRPQNFAERRIAGVARLLAVLDLRRGLFESVWRRAAAARDRAPGTARDWRREAAAVTALFEVPGDGSYWAGRYTLGGKPAPRPMQLVGGDRAASVAFNALVPILILEARRRGDASMEEFAWELMRQFPALPANSVTTLMRRRLFGPAGKGPFSFRFEKHNQALLQLHHDCCANPAGSCDACPFAAKAAD